MIHSDLMGPFPHPSINKVRFFLIFVDDFSCFTWIYFLRKKSEVFQHLKDFKSLIETQSKKKIKVLVGIGEDAGFNTTKTHQKNPNY
jgi:hypothetical protein